VNGNCPACGVALERPWDPDRPTLNHQPGSKACKVRAWAAEAQRRDLMRVDGPVAVVLAELGVPVVYGPVVAKAHPFEAKPKHAFVSSAFVPRAAWLVHDTLAGGGDRSLLPRERERLESAMRCLSYDAEFAAAVSSVGALLDKTRERRAAVLSLIRNLNA
jgi:hypothetical protein